MFSLPSLGWIPDQGTEITQAAHNAAKTTIKKKKKKEEEEEEQRNQFHIVGYGRV